MSGKRRMRDSRTTSWRRRHFSWPLKDHGGKVKCIYSFDHLFNKNIGLFVSGSVPGAEDIFMNKIDRFSEAGILVGAADNKQMNVQNTNERLK